MGYSIWPLESWPSIVGQVIETVKDGKRNLLMLEQDDEDILVKEYRGLACLITTEGAGDWKAEKIVVDAKEGIEWLLPDIPFLSVTDAMKYLSAIIDAAFPREQFGENISQVECLYQHQQQQRG